MGMVIMMMISGGYRQCKHHSTVIMDGDGDGNGNGDGDGSRDGREGAGDDD